MTTKISVYNLGPSVTTAIGSGGGPKIQTIVYPGNDTAVNTAGGDVVILTGSGFVTGCTIVINGSLAGSVTFNSSSNVQFTAPAQSSGGYPIYLVNPDGGTAIAVPGLQYSGVPNWSTAAGTLGSVYETTGFANTVIASGDAPITYSVYSGSLPTGASLNSSNGYISGTSSATASSTTYNFTIRATDAQNQDTDRAFSLTVNPDVVTWSSPANNVVYSVGQNSAISNVSLTATSAAGYGVQYSANTLPTGLTLSGSTISGTPTVLGNTNSLITATSNTTSRTAQQIINWVVTVGGDLYMPYVATLLSANTSTSTYISDASTNNFAITPVGSVKPNNFNPLQGGYYSNYFDGSTSALTFSNPTALGSGSFTMECWVYLLGTPSVNYWIYGYRNGADTSPYLFINSSRVPIFGGDISNFVTGTAIPLNTWTHIAVVRNGTAMTLYQNGVSTATATTSQNFSYTGSNGIGKSITSTAYYLNGYISNFRIVSGTAVYTSAFTPPTAPLTAISGTNLLTCQSYNFLDNSTNAIAITNTGSQISSYIPFVPGSSYATYGSTYFNGSTDYSTVADNASLQMGSSDFTYEAWIYPTSAPNAYNSIFYKRASSANYSGVGIAIKSTGVFSVLVASNSSTWGIADESSATFQLNVWQHIAVVRSGSNFYFYVNGVRKISTTIAFSVYDSGAAQAIGCGAADGSQPFTGYINGVRIVKGTAIYTAASFTPPAAPLTAVANTSLLTYQNNTPVTSSVFVDNSTNNFPITRNGDTNAGTFSPYGAGWSNYFNGSGDYLSFPYNSTNFQFAGDFTVECWVNLTARLVSYPTIFSNYSTFAANGLLALFAGHAASTTKYSVSINGTDGVLVSSSTISYGTWTHLAISRSGSTVKLFVNGAVEATATNSTTITGTSNSWWISAAGDAPTTTNIQGYISNFRIVKGTALYTAAFTPGTSPLQAIANTSVLTCQSPNFVDNSGNNFALTVNGSPKVYKYNPFGITTLSTPYYGAYFNGSSDYLTLPANSAFSLGTGDFTFEAWVFPTGTNASAMPIIEIRTSGANATGIAFLRTGNASTLNVYTNGAFVGASSSSLTLNAWNHVALVRSGSGSNNCTYYINGTAAGTFTNTANLTDGSTTGPKIGGSTSAGEVWIGSMSNVRITKGQALYTGTFTPSTSPLTTTSQGATASNVSALILQNSTFIDNSPNNFAVTAATTTVKPTRFSPFTLSYSTQQQYSSTVLDGSAYFDGTGDNLTIPTNAAFEIGSGTFTIELWINPSSLKGYQGILGKTGAADLNGWILYFETNNSINFNTGNGSWTVSLNGGAVVPLNQWTHVAVTKDSSNVYRLFVNGNQVATTTNALTTNTTSGLFYIGKWPYFPSYASTMDFGGYMSNIRIIKGTALYTSAFVPPTSPVTPVQNTTLLVSAANGGIIDSSMQTNFETFGDARISTAVTKFTGGSSIYFDGTGDYLTTSLNQNLQFGTGDFTVECWSYLLSKVTNYPCIFGNYNSYTTGALSLFAGHNSGTNTLYQVAVNGATFPVIQSTTAISYNNWVHLAVVRSSGVITLYVNGVANGTYSFSGALNGVGSNFCIGTAFDNITNGYINGYLSDFRVTKGYARYTANFTPSTVPFSPR